MTRPEECLVIRRTLVTLAVLMGIAAPPVLAQAPAETVRYYHTDAIGSVRAVTNEAGQVVAQHDLLPFGGEPANAADPSPLRFTGKERDRETGLDYFGARYYANALGRFTSVDPLLPIQDAVANPQIWNRCAYVTNNPIKRIDPDGRQGLNSFSRLCEYRHNCDEVAKGALITAAAAAVVIEGGPVAWRAIS